MSTQVQICNLALTYLGHEAQIVSVSPPDGSREAELFARYWTPTLEEIISEDDWPHCTKVVSLAQLANPPQHLAWNYAYDLPSDMVRPIAAYADGLQQPQTPPVEDIPMAPYVYTSVPYEMGIDPDTNKLVLFSNEPTLWLKYTFVNNETTTFPQVFSDALSWLLATKIAVPLLKDMKLQEYAFKQYRYWVEKAKQHVREDEAQFRKNIVSDIYPIGLNPNNGG